MASGQTGTTSFTNAAVELTGTGDTANVTSFVESGVKIFGNPLSSLTVTIAGVGTATVTDQSAFWAIPAGIPPSTAPAVIIGREDRPGGVPVLDSTTGLGLVTSNALAGYTRHHWDRFYHR